MPNPSSNGAKTLNVLVLPPPSLCRKLFSPTSEARLGQLANRVDFNPDERDWSSDELAQRIGEFDVLVTGWRSPKLTAAVPATMALIYGLTFDQPRPGFSAVAEVTR